jgi:hypothetical protein
MCDNSLTNLCIKAISYFTPDNCTFLTPIPRTSQLTIIATSSISSLTISYAIKILNSVTGVTLTTSPSDTSQLYNDGCNTYSCFYSYFKLFYVIKFLSIIINLATAARTVTFFFILAGNPTNAYYTIDFGDQTVVPNPVAFPAHTTLNITHVYGYGGYFTVILTAYNSVSSVTATQIVLFIFKNNICC